MSNISPVHCCGLLALGALLTACFDVQQVDVPDNQAQTQGLLIDDFERGDSIPSSPLFLHWFCIFTKGCGVWSPGASSQYGYFLNFELHDPPNGQLDYPSSGALRTWRSDKRLDFTPYENLVFSAMLVPGDLALPDSIVIVRLSCPAGGDASDVIASISSRTQVGNGWQTYKLPLRGFKQLDWQLASLEPKIDANACRAQIDGLGFEVQDPTLTDGQAVSGTLMIDDVYLR